jgi:hypothetical protein
VGFRFIVASLSRQPDSERVWKSSFDILLVLIVILVLNSILASEDDEEDENEDDSVGALFSSRLFVFDDRGSQ